MIGNYRFLIRMVVSIRNKTVESIRIVIEFRDKSRNSTVRVWGSGECERGWSARELPDRLPHYIERKG